MRGLTLVFFLSASLLQTGCLEEKSPPVEELERSDAPAEEPVDPNQLVLLDQGGAILSVRYDLGRFEAYLECGSTEDFSVPVRIRFQGGKADEEFRRMTEFEIDEEDYWTYDEDQNRFEVGSRYAFLRSLGMADRVFLEVKLSETKRKALVFDLSEEDREFLAVKMDENSERVDAEMRSLGLGKYSRQPSYQNSDPLKMNPSEEALLVLYDQYLLSVAKVIEMGISPELSDEDEIVIEDEGGPVRFVSPMINYFRVSHPEFIANLRPVVENYGFESVAQWAEVGDRVQFVNVFLALDERQPGFLDMMLEQTPAEIQALKEEDRLGIEAIQAFSENEMDWFARNRERFTSSISR